MSTKIAINGFGRIGRLSFRQMLLHNELEVVAINDLTDTKTLAYLLKYDSVHGRFPGEVSATESELIVNGKTIRVYAEKDPAKLPWTSHQIDIVIESTGRFVDKESASKHIEAGASRVIISAPGKGNVTTVVLGVNDEALEADDPVISNASCTTNCLAPMAKVLHQNFGIEKGYITTIHAYTADQRIQDAPHRDLRRARAAAINIVPTTTGAARAVGIVLPELQGKLDGNAMRVPVPDGSVTDFTVILQRDTTVEAVNNAMREASLNGMKGILEYNEDPLVSSDIVGNRHSCVFDSGMTTVNGNFVKIVGWYDNEAGYASRVADLARRIAQRLAPSD